jgi:hypothetical protein
VANNRKKIPPGTELRILTLSKRRCALCFGLYGDIGVRPGQIAHVNRDRTNNLEDNLAFLCLPHHDEYDTKRSQSKRFTSDELRAYRAELYARMAEQPGLAWADADTGGASRSRRKLGQVIAAAAIDFPAVWKFGSETDEALFLFDRHVSEYLAQLYKQGLQLAVHGEVLKGLPVGDERAGRVDRQMELVLWFNEQFGALRAKLAPYLTLG